MLTYLFKYKLLTQVLKIPITDGSYNFKYLLCPLVVTKVYAVLTIHEDILFFEIN